MNEDMDLRYRGVQIAGVGVAINVPRSEIERSMEEERMERTPVQEDTLDSSERELIEDAGASLVSGKTTEESKISGTSSPSSRQAADSRKQWRTPTNVRELASQMNAVATMVLNEEIDIDKAKTYNAASRNIVAAISAQVSKARFLGNDPNLDFVDEKEVFDGER